MTMGTSLDKDSRLWGMLCHLSGLAMFSGIPFASLIAPLVIWQIKKEQHPFIDEQGKEAVNFQITLIIGVACAIALAVTIVGLIIAIPALILLGLASLVFPIIGGIRANDGVSYRYPFILRLVK